MQGELYNTRRAPTILERAAQWRLFSTAADEGGKERIPRVSSRGDNPYLPFEDPRMDKTLRAFARGPAPKEGEPPFNPFADMPEGNRREDTIKRLKFVENVFAQGNSALAGDYENDDGVSVEDVKIIGIDDAEVLVTVYEPLDRTKINGTMQFSHGGGMALESSMDPIYVRFGKEMARNGVRVVNTEYRKSTDGHVFPRGLEDCYSSAMWAAQEYDTPVVVAGVSGGGNLAIATCMRAKERDTLENIVGCYALCPMINGEYPNDLYPSIEYYDNYLCRAQILNDCARIYTLDEKDAASPLAWPSKATTSDLKGLPPMHINVNELDPLYDENVEFYRKLLCADNNARMTIVGGSMHSTDMFSGLVEDLANARRVSMAEFVKTLTENALKES